MSRSRGKKRNAAGGPPQEPPPPAIGERLRQTRLARGLELAAVADQLHLKQSTVIALEEEEFERLPARVFVRGYYRNYARLLGLPEAELLRQFDQRCPEGESCSGAPPVGPRSVRREIRSNHLVVRGVTWLMVLLLVVAVGLWWRDYAARRTVPGPVQVQAQPEPPARPVAPTTVPRPPKAPAIQSTPDAPPPSSVVAQSAPVAPPAPAPAASASVQVATAEPPAPKPAPEPPPPRVELRFVADSWVDIRGADHSFKVMGLRKKGTRLSLGGHPPYHMVIGNAGGVTLLVNGRPYDLSAHVRRNVARLTLNP